MLEKADEKEQYKPKPQEKPNRKDISSMLKLLGNLEPQQSVAKKEQIYQDKIDDPTIDLKEKNTFKVKDNNSIISHKSLEMKILVKTYEPEEYEKRERKVTYISTRKCPRKCNIHP